MLSILNSRRKALKTTAVALAAFWLASCEPVAMGSKGPTIDPGAPVPVALLLPSGSGNTGDETLARNLKQAADMAIADLGGSVTDTGLFDWSTFPSIDAPYRKGNPQMWGLTQIKKKGLRDVGATLSSDHAHRIAMGMETLGLRMQRACANTQALAEWLVRQAVADDTLAVDLRDLSKRFPAVRQGLVELWLP